MKWSYTLVFCSYLSLIGTDLPSLYAQQQVVDSLSTLLDTKVSPKKQVELYKDLAKAYFRNGQIEEAFETAETSLTLAEKGGFDSLICAIYMNIGVYNFYTQKYKQAEVYYNKAYALKSHISNELLARLYNNFAYLYSETNRIDESLELYYKSIALNEELGLLKNVSYQYVTIGQLLSGISRYKKAEAVLFVGVEIVVEIKDSILMASGLNSLGQLYFLQSDYSARIGKLLFIQYLCVLGKLS